MFVKHTYIYIYYFIYAEVIIKVTRFDKRNRQYRFSYVRASCLWANVLFMPFGFISSKICKKNVGFPIVRLWNVHDEGDDKIVSCTLNLIFVFIFITV